MGDIISAVTAPFVAEQAGDDAVAAANAGANASMEAARIAADAAKFRPVGVTTRFGASNFAVDPNTGYVTSASSTVAPDIAALRDRLISSAGGFNYDVSGMTNQFAPAAQKLFGLGSQYLAQSPQEVENQYIARTTAALAPQREQELSNIRNRLFQTGRTGLATGGSTTSGMAAANPELAAYYNALAQQDLNIAQTAQQQGQAQQQFAAGLFGTGANILGLTPSLATQYLAPVQSYIGTGSTLEQLGLSPLDLGAQLGGRQAQSGAAQASALLQGGLQASQQQQAGALAAAGARYNALSGALGSVSKMSTPSGTSPFMQSVTGLFGVPKEAYNYGYNPFGSNFEGFDVNSTSTPGLWQDLSFD